MRKAEARDLIEKYGEEDIVLAGSLFVYMPQGKRLTSLVVPTLNLISSMPCATSKIYYVGNYKTWNT